MSASDKNVEPEQLSADEWVAACQAIPASHFGVVLAELVAESQETGVFKTDEYGTCLDAIRVAGMASPTDVLAVLAVCRQILSAAALRNAEGGHTETVAGLVGHVDFLTARCVEFLETYTGLAAEGFTGKQDATN